MPLSIKKHIPNTITCFNLFSGAIAVAFAFEGNLLFATLFILISAIFDFLDGFMARLLGAYSELGKQLDSLADLISFGLAPAVIVFSLFKDFPYPESMFDYAFLFPYAGFFIAVFSALRLAKFNIDESQSTSFKGLPTPANAILIGGVALSQFPFWTIPTFGLYFLLLFVCLSCFLLVSPLPMFSLKMKGFGFAQNKLQYIFLLISAGLIVGFFFFGLALSIVVYILISLLIASRKKPSNAFDV
jgi:CDP-diacylglycerol---serine O-phosphatidyltransferase